MPYDNFNQICMFSMIITYSIRDAQLINIKENGIKGLFKLFTYLLFLKNVKTLKKVF